MGPAVGITTKIPNGISLRDACLATMALEGEFAVDLLGVKEGQKVLIAGMGPGGMFVLEALRERRPALIICADLVNERLRLARELGANEILNAGEPHFLRKVEEISEGGVEIAIDTTGLPVSIKNVFKAVKSFGKIGLFGRALGKMNDFEIEDVFHKFLTVYGLKCHPSAYTQSNMTKMLKWIREGKIHADKLVSHEFPLSRIGEAFEMAAVKKEGMKIVVKGSDI